MADDFLPPPDTDVPMTFHEMADRMRSFTTTGASKMTAKPTFMQWFWRHGVYLFAFSQWGWVTVLHISLGHTVWSIVGLMAIELTALTYVFVQSRRDAE